MPANLPKLLSTCVVRNYELRDGTLRQISRKQHFILPTQTQWHQGSQTGQY
jgi:hypothetical protein